jgi:hypothetical protein
LLDREDCCTLESSARESNHLAIVGATGIRTATGKVVKYVFRWNEEWICKENLRVRGGLMGEEDDKRRPFLVEDGPESQIDLRETRVASLTVESMS